MLHTNRFGSVLLVMFSAFNSARPSSTLGDLDLGCGKIVGNGNRLEFLFTANPLHAPIVSRASNTVHTVLGIMPFVTNTSTIVDPCVVLLRLRLSCPPCEYGTGK
jgi:hypothetical protein